jgi:predicted dehydrogenase
MTLRIGLLGAGSAARELHAPGYLADGRAQVVAVCSRDPARAHALADRLPGARVHPSVESLLDDGVDAVSVCTPPSSHRGLTEAAVAAGTHVLLEKPVAHTLEDARALRALATDAAPLVELMRNERHMDVNQAVADALRSEAVGRLLSLQFVNATSGPDDWTGGADWPRRPALSGGGALLDLAVHKIDLACWWTQSPVAGPAAADLGGAPAGEAEDLGSCSLRLAGGVLVNVVASWIGPADESILVATGTDGVLIAEGRSGRVTVLRAGEVEVQHCIAPWSPEDRSARAAVEAFLDGCLADERAPVEPWWGDATECVLSAYLGLASS